MQSISEIYKIGRGPSSSHTMAPESAVNTVRARFPEANGFRVTLFGSLALTGKGHCTDTVIRKCCEPFDCEVVFDCASPCDVHPNTMDIEVFRDGQLINKQRVYSVGGGSFQFEGEPLKEKDRVYPHTSFTEISRYCKKHNLRLWQYVEKYEGKEIFTYLDTVWQRMKRTVHEGLTTSGVLPGILGTKRRAQQLYNQKHIDESAQTRENRLVCSYALSSPPRPAERAESSPPCFYICRKLARFPMNR